MVGEAGVPSVLASSLGQKQSSWHPHPNQLRHQQRALNVASRCQLCRRSVPQQVLIIREDLQDTRTT